MNEENVMFPDIKKQKFVCTHCKVLSQQKWSCFMVNEESIFYYGMNDADKEPDICISICQSCHGIHIWYKGSLIFPHKSAVPNPQKDMPEEVKKIYYEAGEVYNVSPKASAALLRLAVQHLCKDLGEKGKNINDDIGELVKKGLDPRIQKALDVIRVIGNNAVHPGTIDLDDNKDVAYSLFELLNFIVQQMITQPKKVDDLFKRLPDSAKVAINKRDSK